MFSEIISILKFILDTFEGRKIKNIIYILILLSIVLVKPITYYSTLYVKYCGKCCAVAALLFFFLVCYGIYQKRKEEVYDKQTVNTLLFLLAVFIIFVAIGKWSYVSIWSQIYEIEGVDQQLFLRTIHELSYENGFYDYVRSHFALALLYAIEFMNSLGMAFFLLQSLFKLICAREILKTGFVSADWKSLLTALLVVLVSSPNLYLIYLNFWNRIF